MNFSFFQTFSLFFLDFSAFSLENIQLIQSGHVSTALWYIGLSVILGVLAVGLGLYLAKL